MIQFERSEPGRMYSYEEFNRLLGIVEQLYNTFPDPSITLERAGGATYMATDGIDLFPAKITGQINEDTSTVSPLSCRYSWVEMASTYADCPLAELTGGRAGFADFMPLKDLQGSTSLATDTIVWITLAASRDHYLIVGGSGGGSSIRTTGAENKLVAVSCFACDENGNPLPTTVKVLMIHEDTLTDLGMTLGSDTAYDGNGCPV